MLGLSFLLLLSGIAANSSGTSCFGPGGTTKCGAPAGGDGSTTLRTPYGSIGLSVSGGQIFLGGIMKRLTACSAWHIDSYADPDLPDGQIFDISNEDRSAVCLDNLTPSQAVFWAEPIKPGYAYTILVNGEPWFSGQLPPEPSSDANQSNGGLI